MTGQKYNFNGTSDPVGQSRVLNNKIRVFNILLTLVPEYTHLQYPVISIYSTCLKKVFIK
jgi:hypothetical protein